MPDKSSAVILEDCTFYRRWHTVSNEMNGDAS